MTRKRYVKLLMGHGYSRDTAKLYAERALARGRTYRQDYNFRMVGISISKGFEELAEAIMMGFDKVAAEMRALREAYQAAIDKEKEPEA